MNKIVFSLPLTRSRQLFIYLIVIHTVMLITVFAVVDFLPGLLLAVAIIISFIMSCRRYNWLAGKGDACIKIERDATGLWGFIFDDGEVQLDLVLQNSVVTSQFVLLNFERRRWWKSCSITIMSDAVECELFRQLRVYCRDPNTFQQ